MIINDWYCCSHCKQKLFKVKKNASVKGIEFKCKKCKQILNINIEPMSLQSK